MPNRCVVAGCNNTTNIEEGISLHSIPFYDDNRPEAKKRRKKWVDFVKSKRARWTTTQHSVICSKHFKEEDFDRMFSIPGEIVPKVISRLKRDDFGVHVYPSIHSFGMKKSIHSRKRNINVNI